MKSLLRAATMTVASIALVAGSTTAANAAPGDTAAVTGVALQPTATYFATSNAVVGNIAVTPGITSLRATVNVNGVPVANDVYITPGPQGGFYYNRAWGIGSVSLTNFVAGGQDGEGYFSNKAIPAPANAVTIRYAVNGDSSIRVTKRGKKLTFRLKARYTNAANKTVGLRTATIQVKKSGKWKTLKNVRLKSNGTATYKRKDKKKRNYRMLIKSTSTVLGGTTGGTRKI